MNTQTIKYSPKWTTESIKSYPNYYDMGERLANLLPHGSGINYKWHIWQAKQNKSIWYASNNYSAMDEWGGYCHTYKFTARYQINYSPITRCQYCNGNGIRYLLEFEKYNWDFSIEESRKLFQERNNHALINFDSGFMLCNVCYGNGYNHNPFTLTNINFHGQNEYTCCGYGLIDYLWQTLEYMPDL